MSTEIDETRVQEDGRHVEDGEHGEHGEEWSSDEAAAEQEEMMADPPRVEGDGTEFDDENVAADYSGPSAAVSELHGDEPLIADEAMDDFLSRWNGIQVSFVDDPHTSVENAYALTQEVGAALMKSLTDRSGELASGWREASDTEQLRLALKQYRAFLGVLLPK